VRIRFALVLCAACGSAAEPPPSQGDTQMIAPARELRLTSETPCGPMAIDLWVNRGYAYVVSLGGGLHVFDVRDPTAPRETFALHEPEDAEWNAVTGNALALYVASNVRGMHVFDLADPARPALVRSVPEPTSVHTIMIDGKRAAAAAPARNEVLLFDLTDPLDPKLRGTFEPTGNALVEGADAYPHDIYLFEERLYVSAWYRGYIVADVSTFEAPRQLGRIMPVMNPAHTSVVTRRGDQVIAFEGGEGPGSGLRVLDVTDPTKIEILAERRKGQTRSIHNFVLEDDKLYVAHYQDGIRIFDVRDPAKPIETAYYQSWHEGDEGGRGGVYQGASAVRVEDDLIYATDLSRCLLIIERE
jgi:hypothetical protein